MTDIKRMAFSGSWYPSDPAECRQSIETYLTEKDGPQDGAFFGGIVPHAGWYFSGSIACRVIASLSSSEPVELVVLFGGHMHPDATAICLASGAIETPFGRMLVSEDMADRLSQLATVQPASATDFPEENTLELQFPFVHHFFPNAKIFACCVPPNSSAIEIGKRAAQTAQDLSLNARFIGSTDMTHYGPNYGFTPVGTGKETVDWVKQTNDRHAIAALLDMDGPSIIHQGRKNQNMCCAGAAAAAATASKEYGAVKAMPLDYATSYEKSAGTSFVGYSGILYA